jgi:hypothetical protein
MPRTPIVCALLALLASATTGCAILAPGTGYSGGSATLSEAVHAAQVPPADTVTKVRRMDAGQTNPPVVAVDVVMPLTPVDPAPVPEPPVPAHHHDNPYEAQPLFGIVGGAGFLGGGRYDRLETYGLSGGNYEDGRSRWEVRLTASDVYFKGESRLDRAFKNAYDLEISGAYRWYLTEPNTFMGAYCTAGGGTGTVFWDYAGRLPVVHDGVPTTVGDDHINHFDAFAGLGVSLMQTRHFHLGGSLVGGVRLYGWHTYNGFDNNELPTTGFARMLVEINYRL